MKKIITVLAVGLTLLPLAAFAAPKTSATVYQCSKCHMKFSATVAKKDHYKDPMDGGTLVAVKTATLKSGSKKPSSSMSSMGM